VKLLGAILSLAGCLLIAVFGLRRLRATRKGDKRTTFLEDGSETDVSRNWSNGILGRVGVGLLALGVALHLYAYLA